MESALLIIAVLAALLVTLLAVPVAVAFRIDRIEKTSGELHFRWLFGLVRIRAGIPGQKKAAKKQREKAPAKRKEGKRGNAKSALALLRDSSFRGRVIRLGRDILRAIKGRELYLRLRIGLGDPADTGLLWAIMGPVAGLAANLRNAEVRIEPEFMDYVVEVESRGEIQVVPLRFVALAAAFVVSPVTLRALYLLRQGPGQ